MLLSYRSVGGDGRMKTNLEGIGKVEDPTEAEKTQGPGEPFSCDKDPNLLDARCGHRGRI